MKISFIIEFLTFIKYYLVFRFPFPFFVIFLMIKFNGDFDATRKH